MAYGGNGKKLTKDHHRVIFETASGCFVCDGPQNAFKPLGKWTCPREGCDTENFAHMAYCHKKGCSGLPKYEFRESQAAIQQKRSDLKAGTAPYVPPSKRGANGGGAKGGSRSSASGGGAGTLEAKNRELQAQNKKLQDQLDGKGRKKGGGAAGGTGATTTAADTTKY